MAEEKIVTINLRKKLVTMPKWKRSSALSRYLRKILKQKTHNDKIIIDRTVNEKIWSKGGKNPLTKLKLKISKQDDTVKVELQ